MKCEYKAERISGDLEKYLNEKGSQGWRCVSVTTATGLGWTQTVVWEKEIDWEIRDQENGKKILRYEYKVERISGDLEKYLNEKGSQGWRCVSVTTATGLGWTQIVVLEKKLDDLPATEYIDIPKQEEHENDTNKVENRILNKILEDERNKKDEKPADAS